MINGLLVCAGIAQTKNIGDYIQSVAQEQFYDAIDTYVERENMDKYVSKEKTNVIMNAWFMHNPEKFPPSGDINPLFISMHIVPDISERFFSKKTIEFLKKYEPIGARDTGTKETLEKNGIKSYFSGCLTLTLGLKYKDNVKEDKLYFVDPYYELGNGKRYFFGYNILYAACLVVKHYRKISVLRRKFSYEFHTPIRRISKSLDNVLHLASFYDTYSKIFDDNVLMSATYLTHDVRQERFHYDNDEKLEYARELIRKYAKAKLVVTSRIHCALPCLGLETPVVFVTSDNLNGGKLRSGGRFGGLIELLNVMKWTPQGVKVVTNTLRSNLNEGKITVNSKIVNDTGYMKFRDMLIAKTKEFVLRNSNGGGKITPIGYSNNKLRQCA